MKKWVVLYIFVKLLELNDNYFLKMYLQFKKYTIAKKELLNTKHVL